MTLNLNGTSGVSGVDGSAGTPTYQGGTTGGANAGLFFPAANTAALATTSTERFRVSSTGQFGLGTTTPSYAFDVFNTAGALSGAAKFSNQATYSSSVGLFISAQNTSAQYNWLVGTSYNTASNFEIIPSTATNGVTFSTPALSVQGSTGNVGINTAATTGSVLTLKAGSTTSAPLTLTSGTNLSSIAAGTMEYDGVAPYFTPTTTSGRGLLLDAQYYEVAGTAITGPTIANTGQTATITIASPAVVTVTTLPNNGTIVVFTTTGALPTGLTAGVEYFVINGSGATFNVSLTRGGTAINTSGTQSGTQTATFYSSITNTGVNLSATTRYAYELYTTFTKTSANAVTLQYALTQASGTLASHSYEVFSMTAATAQTITAQSLMTNYITTGFVTPVSVTGASAASANTVNIVTIKGVIETTTAITNLNFTLGANAAPTTSTFGQGTYVLIYPISTTTGNTSVGSWA